MLHCPLLKKLRAFKVFIKSCNWVSLSRQKFSHSLELVLRDDIVCPSKGRHKISPNTLTFLLLPFPSTRRRRKLNSSINTVREEGKGVWTGLEMTIPELPPVFCFFKGKAIFDKGSLFFPLAWPYLSQSKRVAISTKQSKKITKILTKVKNWWGKSTKSKHLLLSSLWVNRLK